MKTHPHHYRRHFPLQLLLLLVEGQEEHPPPYQHPLHHPHPQQNGQLLCQEGCVRGAWRCPSLSYYPHALSLLLLLLPEVRRCDGAWGRHCSLKE